MSVASTNWAGNLTYSADAIHHPTSVAEVQQLVTQHSRVKALGTRHSFNTIADSPGGALISLSKLPPDDRQCGAGIECNVVWLKLDARWRVGGAQSP